MILSLDPRENSHQSREAQPDGYIKPYLKGKGSSIFDSKKRGFSILAADKGCLFFFTEYELFFFTEKKKIHCRFFFI